ncbi:hypothetical protein GYMLUDRAFT_238595 [Collybiopsis luxurians FD-317 M1]|nr:hypothetical protein GYMLUDRAFT_238595 [Collybiopsis luxurians FD-317 M1]
MNPLLALAALATALGVSAQSGISQQCSTTLAQIATNPASACLSPSSLIPLLSSSGNTSLVDGINSWLSNACSTARCSNASLSAIVTNVTSGCGTELSTLGFSSSDPSSLISTVQQFYPTVRQVVCLKDGNTNCITETLTNIQTAIGSNLTLTNVEGLISSGNVSLPANVTCTNCIKAAYSTVNSAFPGLIGSDQSALQQQCGSSFTDGTIPSGIVESASNSSSTSSHKNGAPGATSVNSLFGISSSVLLILGSAFVMA